MVGAVNLGLLAEEISEPLKGVPEVFAEGQGGCSTSSSTPTSPSNSLVYIAYAERGDGGAGTAVARGKLGRRGSR